MTRGKGRDKLAIQPPQGSLGGGEFDGTEIGNRVGGLEARIDAVERGLLARAAQDELLERQREARNRSLSWVVPSVIALIAVVVSIWSVLRK